jgi:uncharacterized membrane protein YgcG
MEIPFRQKPTLFFSVPRSGTHADAHENLRQRNESGEPPVGLSFATRRQSMFKTIMKVGMASAFLLSSFAIASAQNQPNRMDKKNQMTQPEKDKPGAHATGGSGDGGSGGSGGGAGGGGGGGSGGGR